MGGPRFRVGLCALASTWRFLRAISLLFVTSLRCPKSRRVKLHRFSDFEDHRQCRYSLVSGRKTVGPRTPCTVESESTKSNIRTWVSWRCSKQNCSPVGPQQLCSARRVAKHTLRDSYKWCHVSAHVQTSPKASCLSEIFGTLLLYLPRLSGNCRVRNALRLTQ